jgi:hypothetical protein
MTGRASDEAVSLGRACEANGRGDQRAQGELSDDWGTNEPGATRTPGR